MARRRKPQLRAIEGEHQPYSPPETMVLVIHQGDLPEGAMAEWKDRESAFVVRRDATRAQQLWALHGLIDLVWTGESTTLRRDRSHVEAVQG